MREYYKDILDLTPRKPLWFDENGVPRYVKFEPLRSANVYARECCLLLIECQNCGHEFQVCMSRGFVPFYNDRKLSDEIEVALIHYGDPPNVNCCPAGPTMNSVPIRVLEYWQRTPSTALGWYRMAEFEISVASPLKAEQEELT